MSGNLTRNIHDRLEHVFCRIIDIVNEPNITRLFCTDSLSGVRHLTRPPLWNQFHQARISAHIGRHTNCRFVYGEKRITRRIATVTGRDQVHRATHRGPLNRNKHRHSRFFKTGERILQCHAVMPKRLCAHESTAILWTVQATLSKH